MQPTDIDPALALMAEFGQITNGTTRHINQMRQDSIFADGAVPARYKALAAMLWAVSARCEPCFKFYVQQAVRLGAAKTELGEFLAVAATMGGCVGEMWALKAFKAYKDLANGEPAPAADEQSCCSSQ
ncbi:carboxymuconolactone decarboxylase family protein (plasmid) [Methylocapsa polymorpha]|uniref:Carboxymuconolactone decarboxylase family protein n=1 Tax=Methylocapsa polymorpha TaxID=3080828 RepID=A0ABZ0HZG3_9HYPH|nr:carboxymuconolactone decarboxylase family protein [Methylocapsa sp. RX1]WOJ91725.1 carboxymuconolactone decarboxylase family protein [Methylocapsa sp. RX1]